MNELESILPLLRCPITGNTLRLKNLEINNSNFENSGALVSEIFLVSTCGQFAYPIISGIPHLLRERAISLLQ